MVTLNELKDIVILSYLTDEMLEKMLPITNLLMFDEGETLFKENDHAEWFYMLKRGKVLLEQKISDDITVFVGSIKPGYSLGWSSMLDGEHYTSDAVCAETCEVLAVKGSKLKDLLDNDFDMGYRLTQRLLRVIKKRMDYRKEQLLRVIKHHPDIKNLL
ncbi:MAG: cyclic nucleotide-binding domain-containing protein [Desulfobacterales bacterium]|nr:cyclic nucleotide-binding domain-containing protein [Desulfobacterales bacterium]